MARGKKQRQKKKRQQQKKHQLEQQRKNQLKKEEEERKVQDDDDEQNLQNVELKKSKIPNAGNGVFATKDFPKGVFVAIYQGVWKQDGSVSREDRVYSLDVEDENHSGETFVGERNPNNCGINEFGQFVNDSTIAIIPQNITDINNWIQPIITYYVNSMMKRNVKLQLRMTTIKKIKKGRELYCSYGFLYWVAKRFNPEGHSTFYINDDVVLTYQIREMCEVIGGLTAILPPSQLRKFERNYRQIIDIASMLRVWKEEGERLNAIRELIRAQKSS